MEKELVSWLSKKLEIANETLIEKDLYNELAEEFRQKIRKTS